MLPDLVVCYSTDQGKRKSAAQKWVREGYVQAFWDRDHVARLIKSGRRVVVATLSNDVPVDGLAELVWVVDLEHRTLYVSGSRANENAKEIKELL